MKLKRFLSHSLRNLIAIVCSLVFFVPMIVVVVNSFKSRAESYNLTLALPKEWLFNNYLVVIERGKLITSFLNSMLYATASVLLVVLLTAAAAFVISRNQTRIHRFFYYYVVLGIAMPINFIALMKVMQMTHLINTRIGMILLYASINLPISLFICCGFVGTISKEIDEAAVIDGCGSFTLFYKIIAPLLKPVIATIAVLNFMSVWNDFMMPLYFLNSSSRWPMTLAVYNFFGMYQQEWNLVCANIVLTSLPVLLVYMLGQKHIVSGLTSGAVKG